MLALKQKSKTSPRITVFLFAALLTVAATVLVRPAAGLAAPVEPTIGFQPGSHEFGLQPVYNTAHAGFELRNEGAEEVWVESLQTSGPDSGSFWVGNSNCWSGPVQPGESCSLEVNFNPGEPFAEYEAQVRARVNGFDFYAGLSGTGASPWFSADPNPVDFGSAKVDGAGVTREIEVVNAGNWPGGVFIAVISGGAVGSFQLLDESCTNRLLAPAATCTAQVRFRPLSEGVKKATFSLFGESDGGSQVVLTGVGAAPDPAPEPSLPPASAAATAVAPIVVRTANRPRAELRERKLRQRLHRKQRLQRHLRVLRRNRAKQRRLRTLRRQRTAQKRKALRRHRQQG
ncbi:MAG TPA: choice-of-anchor D domain-containing protein [Solirubrobacterales bacterium]|nr:choice-of-anchor D domain-containing protein [Solirubrobacterales bacterium]